MKNAKWVKLIEVNQKMHADLVESYFKAHGIEIQVIIEAYFEYRMGARFGPAEILVPDFQLNEARILYEKSGWDFDATETDDDEYDEEDEE